MKKFFLYVFSFIFFFSSFIFIGLDSYALVTVQPLTNGFSSGTLEYSNVDSTYLTVYEISENSQFNRLGIVAYFYDWTSESYGTETWYFINVLDLLNATTSDEPFAYAVKESIRISDNFTSTSNQTWVVDSGFSEGHPVTGIYPLSGYFDVDFPVFNSKEDAINYYRYGLLDEDSIRYGAENLNDTHYTEQIYDPLKIPAPTVEWVSDQYGNFTHKLHFLNNGYFGEHNTQLNYGLLLEMHWLSVDAGELSLISNTSNLNTRYKFVASSFCQSDQIAIYAQPSLGDYFDFSDYECPPYLDLDQNGLAINGFNSMLNSFPVSGRNLTSAPGYNNSSSILNNVIKTGLGQVSYRMNCPSVSCQYFVIGDDNKLYKGPITRIHIGFPNPSYFSDVGTMTSYEPSTSQDFNPETGDPITPPTTTNPPSAPNPGVQDPYQIPSYDNVDASDLVDNMGSLFDFVGQVPMFMSRLFSFLPQWIIVFIAVAIGLMVAIGVVKLFLG